MNPDLNRLQPYPFEKLAKLKDGVTPPTDLAHIALSIGETRHAAPLFVVDKLRDSMVGLSSYPLTKGSDNLRESIAQWLIQRFALPADSIDPGTHVLPVNGTREALFALAQCVVDREKNPLVLIPNPFYQIYEGAALLSGATPVFYNMTADNAYIPDFDAISEDTWAQCQLLYLCSPGNPTGTVLSEDILQKLIRLAEQYDFVIASDECYSEIYFDENDAPCGLLQAAANMGNDSYRHCVVFHSLSKRSNLPGLRSGFVAGDADIMRNFLLYRTYHGCAMPPAHQETSLCAWQDEDHVRQNRRLYRDKFDRAIDILTPVIHVTRPDAAFYLWMQTPVDDTVFARQLYEQQNVTVLPGQYLSRENGGINPGKNHVRMAMVAGINDCEEALQRIKTFCTSIQ